MSVRVNHPPRAPTLSGDYRRDYATLHRVLREALTVLEQVRERTGGEDDLVASVVATAGSAASVANASQAGADIPTSGGAITLNPANPLTSSIVSQTHSVIAVAGHTRTGAAAALIAANVADEAARGYTYYVYYADAGNNGGAQTFLATTDLATVTGTAGYRIIGTIAIAAANYNNRDTGGGGPPP